MNPQMYQAMMQANSAQDPMVAQQQMMANYHPAQLQQPQQGGQMGMSIGQMQGDVMRRKMQDAQKLDSLNAQGGI